jgi:hypothetical protein
MSGVPPFRSWYTSLVPSGDHAPTDALRPSGTSSVRASVPSMFATVATSAGARRAESMFAAINVRLKNAKSRLVHACSSTTSEGHAERD